MELLVTWSLATVVSTIADVITVVKLQMSRNLILSNLACLCSDNQRCKFRKSLNYL